MRPGRARRARHAALGRWTLQARVSGAAVKRSASRAGALLPEGDASEFMIDTPCVAADHTLGGTLSIDILPRLRRQPRRGPMGRKFHGHSPCPNYRTIATRWRIDRRKVLIGDR